MAARQDSTDSTGSEGKPLAPLNNISCPLSKFKDSVGSVFRVLMTTHVSKLCGVVQ